MKFIWFNQIVCLGLLGHRLLIKKIPVMQRYKITKVGCDFLRLPKNTIIVVPVGNKPAAQLWKALGKPFGKTENLLKHLTGK